MAKLTRDDVLKLAHLAKLELTKKEVELYAEELGKILEYVEQLQNIDLDGISPTTQVTGLTDVARADKVEDYGYEPRELMKNLPKQPIDGQIKVRRIL